jgi:AcrR family transcriptional regulator
VAVAIELFGRRAYERVSLDDVAEHAGVRRGLLYRYFPRGMADLHLAAVEESWRRLVDAVDTDPGRPLARKLEENVARLFARAEGHDPAVAVLAGAFRSGDPRVRAVAREARRAWAREMALNHLGTPDVGEPVLAALCGYLAFAELVLAEWRGEGAISRDQAEALVREALPPLVRVARSVGTRPTARPGAGGRRSPGR